MILFLIWAISFIHKFYFISLNYFIHLNFNSFRYLLFTAYYILIVILSFVYTFHSDVGDAYSTSINIEFRLIQIHNFHN